MEKKIFISYSSKDVTIANQMVAYLEDNGCVCWIAPRNITSGQDYTDMINDAINDCDGLVMIMSDNSVKSQWVKKELSTAVSYNKTIIPFKITNVNLSGGLQFMLNNVQWIDATSNAVKMFPQVIKGLGGEGACEAVSLDEDKTSRGKKGVWIIVTVAMTAIAVAVVLLLPSGSEPEEILPEKHDSVIVEKKTDSVALPIQSVESNTKATSEKRIEATLKNKEKQTIRAEAITVKSEKNEKKQEEATSVSRHEEEASASLADEQGDNPSQPAQNISSPKLRKAKTLWGQKKYKEALKLFQELKKTDPNNPEIDRFISDCRSHL